MMTLQEAATAVEGTLIGADTHFRGISTDSRKITPGDLFIALRGENFDGHEFVNECLGQGAVAAMVSQMPEGRRRKTDKPLLLVKDARLALGHLAAHWRSKFVIPLAAITGSNGKTSVKEMLASILAVEAGADNVMATIGNLNNDIGLPLTLLRLRKNHRYAITEMGMNHAGEIDYMTHLAKPTVALVNNAQAAHLQGLGSLDAIASAKGEIFAGLAEDGIAVINADDVYANYWKVIAGAHRVMTFGMNNGADVGATVESLQLTGSRLCLKSQLDEIGIQLQVPGLHNVRNALAAATVAIAMGLSLDTIKAGLESFTGVKGRLQHKVGKGGCTIIDDSYNANPNSMRAAIDVLATCGVPKILVMGDMGELGETAAKLHQEIGTYAKNAGITQLFALGELSKHTVQAFGTGATHFNNPQALAAMLESYLVPQATVLVKGSRFMQMERLVALITNGHSNGNGGAH
ncbi:MAG: UDP-N-acetylmuramoyl-tripeptide--D-alanyl-D-alanine ligase [Methylophilales bacterium]|nr:UDP-N-acetylmuramoyl-tripeptide--D-alanyl-D-alanine ligase [Methylophilales bacterium]